MAYTRVNWEDSPSTATPRNAANLNKMDKGIKDLEESLSGVATSGSYGDLSNKPQINNVELSGNKTLDNIGVPPKSHASSTTNYGVGTTSNYGHCKTRNNLTANSYTDGEALSAYQGYVINNKFNYSTTEKAIGTWTDGSTIYARTINLSSFVEAITQSWTTVASVSGWNISKIIDSILLSNASMSWTGYFLRVNNNNLQVWNGMPSNWNVQHIVLYYTKSS